MKVIIEKRDFTIIWDGVYYFALSDFPNITPWELKKLLAFIEFEKRHGRQTEISCDDKNIMDAVNHAIAHPQTVENALLPDKITECTYCNHNGCLTEFVCHTASVENAKKIFSSGMLLSAVKASGKTVAELITNIRNGASDPDDYFDYIMFSWGNCITGDSLVTERNFADAHGRLPSQEELDNENSNHLITGVRFYFRHEDILKHPGYTFDGYHPAKVKDELIMSDYLYVCVTSEKYKNELDNVINPEIANKILYLPDDKLGLLNWTDKVYESVEKWGVTIK